MQKTSKKMADHVVFTLGVCFLFPNNLIFHFYNVSIQAKTYCSRAGKLHNFWILKNPQENLL